MAFSIDIKNGYGLSNKALMSTCQCKRDKDYAILAVHVRKRKLKQYEEVEHCSYKGMHIVKGLKKRRR